MDKETFKYFCQKLEEIDKIVHTAEEYYSSLQSDFRHKREVKRFKRSLHRTRGNLGYLLYLIGSDYTKSTRSGLE